MRKMGVTVTGPKERKKIKKEFTRNKKYFKHSFIYTLINEMRDPCNAIKTKQYKQLSTLLIPSFLESHDTFYFNILSIITLFNNLYVEN